MTTFLGGKDKCIAISTFYEIINNMQGLVSLVKEDCQNETGATLEKLWNDKDLTDVTLVSKDGQQVLVHRAILCSRSSFLRGILMESLHQNTFLYLSMADHLVLEALVQFVYLSTCTIPCEQLKSLAEMANQLGVGDLESAIEKVSERNATEQSNTGNLSPVASNGILPPSLQNFLEFGENIENLNQKEMENSFEVQVQDVEVHENGEIKREESMSWKIEKYKQESNPDESNDNKNFGRSQYYEKLPKIEMIPPNLDGGFSCNVCNRLCSTWTKLKHHILQVHEGYLYKCTKCEEQFGSIPKIESHHVEKHSKAPFRCEICQQNFIHQRNLRTHQGESQLQCTECDFIACNKTLLVVHSKTHDPRFLDGLFKCNFCEYRNKRRSNLDYHVNLVHEKVKGYLCDQCTFESSRKNEVVEHKKVRHEGIKYKCDSCDYTANRSGQVNRHIAVKHNGFRYQCTQCDYKSISTSGLQDHIVAKHDKTAFSCPFCSVQVFYKNSLQRHIKQHAKIKLETSVNHETIIINEEPKGAVKNKESVKTKKVRRTRKLKKSQKAKVPKKVKILKKVLQESSVEFEPNCASWNCCRLSATKDKTKQQ